MACNIRLNLRVPRQKRMQVIRYLIGVAMALLYVNAHSVYTLDKKAVLYVIRMKKKLFFCSIYFTSFWNKVRKTKERFKIRRRQKYRMWQRMIHLYQGYIPKINYIVYVISKSKSWDDYTHKLQVYMSWLHELLTRSLSINSLFWTSLRYSP